MPPKVNNRYLGNNNTSVSAIEKKQVTKISFFPRSKSYSTNLMDKSHK
jgi:hypothetical protein